MFVPIALGVKILGAMECLNFLGSLLKLDFVMFSIESMAVLTFLLMMILDTKLNRKLFLAGFSIYKVILLCIFFLRINTQAFRGTNTLAAQNAIANVCNIVKETHDDSFSDSGYLDFSDCINQTTRMTTFVNVMFFMLAAILYVHFIMVVYTNYANSDNTEALGGCRDGEKRTGPA